MTSICRCRGEVKGHDPVRRHESGVSFSKGKVYGYRMAEAYFSTMEDLNTVMESGANWNRRLKEGWREQRHPRFLMVVRRFY